VGRGFYLYINVVLMRCDVNLKFTHLCLIGSLCNILLQSYLSAMSPDGGRVCWFRIGWRLDGNPQIHFELQALNVYHDLGVFWCIWVIVGLLLHDWLLDPQ